MNVKVLIDNIVRQTTVHELEAHGVSRKVAADMFGMALRSYQQKVHRLEESATVRDQSLWEAVLDYVRTHGPVTRAQLSRRFLHDDDRLLASVLNDQVESGLIYSSGRGAGTLYRVTSEEELQQALESDSGENLEALVWIATYRYGPIGAAELAAKLGLDAEAVGGALRRLAAEGRLQSEETGASPVYTCLTVVLPVGTPFGWEAALWDHYTALVQAMGVKLEQGRTRTLPADETGGSTYSFEIWPGHPFEERVRSLLREHRVDLSALREDVERFNRKHGIPASGHTEVVFYFGQSVRERELAGTADSKTP